MGDGTWVGEVVDTGLLVLGEENGGWEEVVEDGVGVGDIDNTIVLGDLGDEVTGVEVIADWHAKSENQSVGVVLHDLFNVCLGLGVEGAVKVGLVGLEETWTANWVGLIVGVDAAGSEDGDVNALQEAGIGQVQGANDIVSDGVLLVVLTPVDVGAASGTSSVEDVSGLDLLQLGDDSFAVLHADGGGVNLLSCDWVSIVRSGRGRGEWEGERGSSLP